LDIHGSSRGKDRDQEQNSIEHLRRSVYGSTIGAAKVSMAIGYPTQKCALERRLKIFLWKILKQEGGEEKWSRANG